MDKAGDAGAYFSFPIFPLPAVKDTALVTFEKGAACNCNTHVPSAGLRDGSWTVDLPADEVPPELPEPCLGINFVSLNPLCHRLAHKSNVITS